MSSHYGRVYKESPGSTRYLMRMAWIEHNGRFTPKLNQFKIQTKKVAEAIKPKSKKSINEAIEAEIWIAKEYMKESLDSMVEYLIRFSTLAFQDQLEDTKVSQNALEIATDFEKLFRQKIELMQNKSKKDTKPKAEEEKKKEEEAKKAKATKKPRKPQSPKKQKPQRKKT